MGLPYEVVSVGFPPDDSYRALNPIGALPFLQDGDVGINESTAMLLYIAQKYGPTPLLRGKDSPPSPGRCNSSCSARRRSA